MQNNSKKNKQNNKNNKNTLKTTEISQPEPEIYLFAVGSRAGYTVFLFCFMFFFEFFCFLFMFSFCLLCFRLVFLSFCLNTTQYTTLNTNKHEMGLFMTCVKCPKQCSISFQITWLSLQIWKVFLLHWSKLEKVHLA